MDLLKRGWLISFKNLPQMTLQLKNLPRLSFSNYIFVTLDDFERMVI